MSTFFLWTNENRKTNPLLVSNHFRKYSIKQKKKTSPKEKQSLSLLEFFFFIVIGFPIVRSIVLNALVFFFCL